MEVDVRLLKDIYITNKEASELLGVNPNTISNLAKRRILSINPNNTSYSKFSIMEVLWVRGEKRRRGQLRNTKKIIEKRREELGY